MDTLAMGNRRKGRDIPRLHVQGQKYRNLEGSGKVRSDLGKVTSGG